jgi:hypothetical protein
MRIAFHLRRVLRVEGRSEDRSESSVEQPPTVRRQTVMRITARGQGRDTLQTLTVALTNNGEAPRDGEGEMPKRIVLLLDGTWNDIDVGPYDTNIVRMRELNLLPSCEGRRPQPHEP